MILSLKEQALDSKQQISQFFDVLKANVVRARSTITAVFLTASFEKKEDSENLQTYLVKKIRKTDFLFQLESLEWCLILPGSGEEEAVAFITRLFKGLEDSSLQMSSCVIEIGNNKTELDELLDTGKSALASAKEKGNWTIDRVNIYKKKERQLIKVSLLEDDTIFQHLLYSSLEKLSFSPFELDIKKFSDGYEFLQSGWYQSSHIHLIIMNDILPKKNGLEILHTLRGLPNHKRFVVFMMTKRKSEDDMVYAFEKGVDIYLTKPFNLRLFEAQVKRTFERLWQ